MPSKKANINGGISPVATEYATALYELAREGGIAHAVQGELAGIADLLASEPKLAVLFAHRTIDTKRRGDSIRGVFHGGVSQLTLNFLLLLNDKGRLDQLAGIAAAFDRMVKHEAGEIDVEVHSAKPLDARALTHVADRVSAALGRKALLHPHVDESLIGGLRIRVGDRLIDGSIRSRLRRLTSELIDAGHEQIKTRAASIIEQG
jgi:F-type H+-transporting ATPase subunit delta